MSSQPVAPAAKNLYGFVKECTDGASPLAAMTWYMRELEVLSSLFLRNRDRWSGSSASNIWSGLDLFTVGSLSSMT